MNISFLLINKPPFSEPPLIPEEYKGDSQWATPKIEGYYTDPGLLGLGLDAAIANNGRIVFASASGRYTSDTGTTTEGIVIILEQQSDGSLLKTQELVGDFPLRTFGQRIAVSESGSMLAVMELYDSSKSLVNIFERQSNGQYLKAQVLGPFDSPPNNSNLQFNHNGKYLVYSNPYTENIGEVRVFIKRDEGYVLSQKIVSPDPSTSLMFGIAIKVSSDSNRLFVVQHSGRSLFIYDIKSEGVYELTNRKTLEFVPVGQKELDATSNGDTFVYCDVNNFGRTRVIEEATNFDVVSSVSGPFRQNEATVSALGNVFGFKDPTASRLWKRTEKGNYSLTQLTSQTRASTTGSLKVTSSGNGYCLFNRDFLGPGNRYNGQIFLYNNPDPQ